jgi:hypothetical protein
MEKICRILTDILLAVHLDRVQLGKIDCRLNWHVHDFRSCGGGIAVFFFFFFFSEALRRRPAPGPPVRLKD